MEDEEYLREQIHSTLNLRETEELVEMWQAHDTEQWTDLAFEVVKGILQDRLGEVPPQDEPVQEPVDACEEGMEEEETLSRAEPFQQPDKALICPRCQSDRVFARAVELRGRTAEVVLKRPAIDLPRFMGVNSDYDEIVGIACEDCGYVFFMLKDFV